MLNASLTSGSGLFIGIELVRDDDRDAAVTPTPATQEASVVCTRMKSLHRILMSIDGVFDNVLVVKPPMCFSRANADALVDALDVELVALEQIDKLEIDTHTPT